MPRKPEKPKAAKRGKTAAKKPPKGGNVVLLSGDEEYRSEEAMPLLGKILAEHHGFKCTVLFSLNADGYIAPTNTVSLAGAEAD